MVPLSRSTARVWYYSKDNAHFGPADFETLQRWAKDRRFGPADRVQDGANGEWQRACDVDGLFPPRDADPTDQAQLEAESSGNDPLLSESQDIESLPDAHR